MKRRKRKHKPNRRNQQRARGPIQLVMSTDGTPFKGDCTCPICAEAARRGEPLYTMENGRLVEVTPVAPEMMTVSIRGDGPVASVLPPWPTPLEIPVGCVAMDLLGYLVWTRPELQEFVNLVPRVGGRDCDPLQLIRAGDEVVITSEDEAPALLARPSA
jgi:hypothetical protein